MPTPPDEPPLVVTAALGRDAFAYLDGLRRRHFPATLNKVPAHISLFHQLPGAALDRVLAEVRMRCAVREAFEARAAGVRFLGRGVAIAYEASALAALHGDLATAWRPWLTAQDKQPFKPHVTIQNKVLPEVARDLHDALAADVLPPCRIEGVTVWRYLGGPWAELATCGFGVQLGATTS